jgi:hypothetical protein
LGENAALLIDDRGVGNNGELTDHTVSPGRHRVIARNGHGPDVSASLDFSDGQRVSLVYDVSQQLLRPMTEADRETLIRNKARQRTETVAVEHVHGVFRGTCKGTLTVGFKEVSFRPETGDHGFTMPFKALVLRTDNRNIILHYAADNRTFETYRLKDAAQAIALKRFWDELSSSSRPYCW